MTRTPILAFLSAAILLAAASPAWSITEIQSARRTGPISIDGSDADWQAPLTRVKEWRADVGIANDDSSLYLCVRFRNPDQLRQVIGLGLTLWVDPMGGKKEFFGIRYPLGARPSGGTTPGGEGGARAPGRPGAPPSGDGGGPDSPGARRGPPGRRGEGGRDGHHDWFGPALQELEIVGPDKKLDVRRALASASGDPGLKIGTLGDSVLVYEIRLPLASSSRLMKALQIAPGALVGLGLQSGKSESGGDRGGMEPDDPGDDGFHGQPGPGGPGGPGGQGGPEGPGGRDGPGGRQRWAMPSSIDAWIRVRLATGGESPH